jgi:hypothetical protein
VTRSLKTSLSLCFAVNAHGRAKFDAQIERELASNARAAALRRSGLLGGAGYENGLYYGTSGLLSFG